MVVMFGEGGKGEGRVDGSEVGRLERGWEGEIVKEEIATESYYAKPHCVITQLVTSCNNDVIFIFGTSTLQSHLRFPLPPPQCIKSQDFTGAGPQSHLQCHWPHLQEDRGGPDHWTGQYDL